MSTTTLRELCARTTNAKGMLNIIETRRDLHARLSPEVALAAWEALNHMRQEMLNAAKRTGVGKLYEHTESWRMINNALRLLDGQPT